MDSKSLATACLQSFRQLATALQDPEHWRTMPREKLEREFDRFKIWCGNLGALQTGRSSLDFRLRESTVVRTNVLKLLHRLQRILTMGTEVATGARLPFEKLPKPEVSEPSDEESEEEDSHEEPPTELGLYMTTVTEILGELYQISFRIRNSTTRPRSMKPSLHKEVDEETGIDKFTVYADFDKRHVEESLIQLRKEAAEKMYLNPSEAAKLLQEDVFLIDRLGATLTERRKNLRYWQRHAKKLAAGPEEVREVGPIQSSAVAVHAQGLHKGSYQVIVAPAASVTVKTILSGTVATEYDRKLDDMLDTRSVMSYASTSFDVQGNVVDLPSPPATAFKQAEFLCPYCGIVYPSSHSESRAWRAHVLQDLQPYVCTYPDCPDRLQMYSTRHAWLEHERLVHRRVWQCFEHKKLAFSSQSDLRRHLESQHDDVTPAQIQDLLAVSESSLADAREKCPICLLDRQFFKELDKHMSFHLEKFATFSVSRGIPAGDEEDSSVADGQSGKAEALRSMDTPPSGTLYFESPKQSVDGPRDGETSTEERPLDNDKEPVVSSEDPETLTSMTNLASTYRDQGRWKEAEELDVQVMETCRRILGQEHPDTLSSMINLASIYKDQERWKEAEELDVQVVETRRRILGQEHSDTLSSMINLAWTYRHQERWKEAEELGVQVLETRRRILGQEHPDTLSSMINLAWTYRHQERWKEAEELDVQVLETRRRILEQEHQTRYRAGSI